MRKNNSINSLQPLNILSRYKYFYFRRARKLLINFCVSYKNLLFSKKIGSKSLECFDLAYVSFVRESLLETERTFTTVDVSTTLFLLYYSQRFRIEYYIYNLLVYYLRFRMDSLTYLFFHEWYSKLLYGTVFCFNYDNSMFLTLELLVRGINILQLDVNYFFIIDNYAYQKDNTIYSLDSFVINVPMSVFFIMGNQLEVFRAVRYKEYLVNNINIFKVPFRWQVKSFIVKNIWYPFYYTKYDYMKYNKETILLTYPLIYKHIWFKFLDSKDIEWAMDHVTYDVISQGSLKGKFFGHKLDQVVSLKFRFSLLKGIYNIYDHAAIWIPYYSLPTQLDIHYKLLLNFSYRVISNIELKKDVYVYINFINFIGLVFNIYVFSAGFTNIDATYLQFGFDRGKLHHFSQVICYMINDSLAVLDKGMYKDLMTQFIDKRLLQYNVDFDIDISLFLTGITNYYKRWFLQNLYFSNQVFFFDVLSDLYNFLYKEPALFVFDSTYLLRCMKLMWAPLDASVYFNYNKLIQGLKKGTNFNSLKKVYINTENEYLNAQDMSTFLLELNHNTYFNFQRKFEFSTYFQGIDYTSDLQMLSLDPILGQKWLIGNGRYEHLWFKVDKFMKFFSFNPHILYDTNFFNYVSWRFFYPSENLELLKLGYFDRNVVYPFAFKSQYKYNYLKGSKIQTFYHSILNRLQFNWSESIVKDTSSTHLYPLEGSDDTLIRSGVYNFVEEELKIAAHGPMQSFGSSVHRAQSKKDRNRQMIYLLPKFDLFFSNKIFSLSVVNNTLSFGLLSYMLNKGSYFNFVNKHFCRYVGQLNNTLLMTVTSSYREYANYDRNIGEVWLGYHGFVLTSFPTIKYGAYISLSHEMRFGLDDDFYTIFWGKRGKGLLEPKYLHLLVFSGLDYQIEPNILILRRGEGTKTEMQSLNGILPYDDIEEEKILRSRNEDGFVIPKPYIPKILSNETKKVATIKTIDYFWKKNK